jgi:hypothetical protein
MEKLVYGKGDNDEDYPKTKVLDGKIVWRCPFYSRWIDMLTRAYSPNHKKRFPTYKGTSVCTEWLKFSNFKKWMESKDWEDNELDKDILGVSKVYSPETCVFVSQMINSFIITSGKNSKTMIGTTLHKNGRFKARIKNPFIGKEEHLGYFKNELDAHTAWKRRKHELSFKVAETQSNPLITKALTTRYI